MVEYHCSKCNFAFSYKSSLVRHQKNCGKTEKPYSCTCGDTFNRSDSLKRHQKRCNPGSSKTDMDKVLCSLCGILCYSNIFSRHLKSCDGSEQSFICSCSKSFKRSDNLKRHQTTCKVFLASENNNVDSAETYNFGLDANGNGEINPSILDYLEK